MGFVGMIKESNYVVFERKTILRSTSYDDGRR
jgi:hypothetical protein